MKGLEVTGAIIIVGAELSEFSSDNVLCSNGTPSQPVPFWFHEILGCSLLERTIQDLWQCGVQHISVLVDEKWRGASADMGELFSIPLQCVENAWASAAEEILKYEANGTEQLIVMSATGYCDLDFGDLLQFHQEQGKDVSGVFWGSVPLHSCVVTARTFAPEFPLDRELRGRAIGPDAARYAVQGYRNSLQSARDLRCLVADSFNATCRIRPYGHEVRPGVWMSEGADVHRGARIVAPAFIGRGARIEEQCLITRCSNIESNCRIDYGTVVEDSTILANTYVGIGLDITHSVVTGNTLLNLERDVALHIADEGIIRSNRVLRKEANRSPVPSLRFAGTR